MSLKTPQFLTGLLHELRKLPKECEWVEFKHNNSDKEEIGSYISALSNSAALQGKSAAFLIWGIDDKTHEILGTTFDFKSIKVGNEELENWLLQRLNPKIHFQFYKIEVDRKSVIILEIPRAYRHPVSFHQEEYIRVGSYKKKLKDFPDKERELWRTLDKTPFETLLAKEQISADEVLSILDYPTYFNLLKIPLPNGHAAILDALLSDEIITTCEAGGYNITNLGAILIARNLDNFSKLRRKAVRIIRYKGAGRIETIKEVVNQKGYASDFENIINYALALVPSNELIEKALRQNVPMYPDLAVRELVANALIHQDFFDSGTGSMVEIFDDRMEITNPGLPLISTERFLDSPPKSRNEKLASLMRRFGVCEERGSGIDKVVSQTEDYQLPAPLFESPNGFTRAVLFAYQEFNDMDKADRIRACYLHCCLQYVQNRRMTNKSLRERFRLPEDKGSVITRIINATTEAGLIINASTSESRRDTSYVPFWSVSSKELK